jgi:ABC-2 type transport system ATP-binding protein
VTESAVVLRGLWKRFGSKVAVAGMDLDVPAGSFFGVVGRNGAGKTTMLRMATGLLRPDVGSAMVAGVDVWSNPALAKARIGILPEEPRSFDRLTGEELLTYNGLLRSMPPPTVLERTTELLTVLDLAEARATPVIDYSQGMRKKIGLACALLHGPEVLFLDEPFESVDPVSARTIREVLDRFCSAGGTVVLSSHVMDTVQRICDHVAVVHEGRVVAVGTVEQVRDGRSLEDVFVDLVGGVADHSADLAWLGTQPRRDR